MPNDIRGIRHQVAEADDEKVRRIVALLDQQPAPAAVQAILEPLRPRLAILRPPRPLRFERLLFLPLDPLIVRTPDWRPGASTIPRSILAPVGKTVRAELGQRGTEIDGLIAGRNTYDATVITEAGDLLWPHAALILADAPPPIGWDATGLPPSVYPALARAIASVLHRTLRLRDLVRDAAVGALEPNEGALRAILIGIAAESPEGCGMIVALLLAQLPNATAQLRRLISTAGGTAEKAMLRQALDQGVDGVLTQMEGPAGFDDEVRTAPLKEVGQEVRRIAALLRDIDEEPDTAKHRPRLWAIRAKLDQVCRARFDAGVNDSLVTPLTDAGGAVDADAQVGIESNARALRALETVARKIGSPGAYDSLLEKAASVVRAAAASGVLTPVRQLRLVEILAGPAAAEALYRSTSQT